MSEDKLELEPDIDKTDVDRAVAASTLVLSAIPTIVPLVAEAVKHGIPKRRIERIARMLKFLGNQVSGLEEDVLAHRMRTEEFLDLFEDGLWQTTRALTEERLAHIASLLKNSIKSDDLAHEQEKMLLSLLEQLNDSELILLGWYGTNMVGERANAYYARHEDIVGPTIRESPMSEEEERNITFRETCCATLQRLGLIGPDQRGSDRITPWDGSCSSRSTSTSRNPRSKLLKRTGFL